MARTCANRTPRRDGEAESGAFAACAVGASEGSVVIVEGVKMPRDSSPQVPNQ